MAELQHNATAEDRLQEFLSRLQKVKKTPNGWQAICPAHEDKNSSLSIVLSNDGVILAHCHAGCSFDAVAQAVGMEKRHFFPFKAVSGGIGSGSRKKIVAKYDYRDEAGDLLYQKIRYQPKEFRIHRSDGAGGWKWNLSGCRRVLYRLPELIKAVRNNDPVYVVEGEKDVESLRLWGLTATCNYDGAGKWVDSYSEVFKDADAVILTDNDQPGQNHGNLVANAICSLVRSVKVILLPDLPDHGDVTDWIEAGGTKDTFLKIVDDAAVWQPTPEIQSQLKKGALIADAIPDLPIPALRKPPFWNVDKKDGVWRDTDKDGHVCACPIPVILHRRLKNIDLATERIEIAFYRDRLWHTMICDYSTIFSHSSIVSLGERGLPVSSTSAKSLVEYFTKLQEVNLDILPTISSVSRMGWATESNFLPGAEGDIVLDSSDFKATNYHSYGNFETWKELVGGIRTEFPYGRLYTSASFAAPLLKLLSQRVFVIHLWGPSRGGKTAALKTALSVWGDPDELIINFNSTKVGLERMASYYCDLPLGIDERQAVGDKQGFVEGLVYLLGLGKGKTRGTKSGGLQTTLSWRTIALTTGEEPISSESSTAGINTRVIELYGQPINDETVSRDLHIKLSQNYGFAGEIYIKKLIEYNKDDLKQKYEAIIQRLAKEHPDKIASHIPALAIIVLADYLSSMWIWGMAEQEAMVQAYLLSQNIVGKLGSAAEFDDSTRAYDYVMSWFMEHYSYFDDTRFTSKFGFYDAEAIYFYPHVFNKTLEEGGFNATRILRDWAEKDMVVTEMRGNEKKKRLKVRKSDPHTKTMAYFIGVRKNKMCT